MNEPAERTPIERAVVAGEKLAAMLRTFHSVLDTAAETVPAIVAEMHDEIVVVVDGAMLAGLADDKEAARQNLHRMVSNIAAIGALRMSTGMNERILIEDRP